MFYWSYQWAWFYYVPHKIKSLPKSIWGWIRNSHLSRYLWVVESRAVVLFSLFWHGSSFKVIALTHAPFICLGSALKIQVTAKDTAEHRNRQCVFHFRIWFERHNSSLFCVSKTKMQWLSACTLCQEKAHKQTQPHFTIWVAYSAVD